jgi:hypothetical protein
VPLHLRLQSFGLLLLLRWLQPLFITTTHYRRLFLPPKVPFDVVFRPPPVPTTTTKFLPVAAETLHGRRFLPSPLATAIIRYRHSRRNLSTPLPIYTTSCPPCFRLQPLPIDDATCRRRFLSTPLNFYQPFSFSIDAVKFLPTPFSIDNICYRRCIR